MSGPESIKPDDHLLDEFLAEQGAVRETYRAMAQEQAPTHLDAAILLAAQEAARPAPRVLRRRWQTPMAAAAVMVLSFGVFLQVRHDPAVQQEVIVPPDHAAPVAAPAVPETVKDGAKADVLAAVAPARKEAEVDQKQASAVAAKPKPALPAEKRRAASADATPPPAPPPPTMTMADAPVPASEPEIAAMAAEAAMPSAAAGAVASESMQRQERFAAAAAPMAKASRVSPTANRMTRRDAPAAVASDAGVAAAIEQWAQSCAAESVALSAPMLWRGLVVASWTRQVNDESVQTTLLFAPDVNHEAITASLGALAAKASPTSAPCNGPVMRELRQSGQAWALVCECAVGAE